MRRPAGLDPDLQRRILEFLATEYPDTTDGLHDALPLYDRPAILANARYLTEHGLMTGEITQYIGMPEANVEDPAITSAGLDFLTEDGGLGAVLGVVTIRLHEETIRQMLLKQIADGDAEPSLKRALSLQIRSLPAKALEQVTMHAPQAGLQRLPDLAGLLRTWLDP